MNPKQLRRLKAELVAIGAPKMSKTGWRRIKNHVVDHGLGDLHEFVQGLVGDDVTLGRRRKAEAEERMAVRIKEKVG